jgi:hypothetical protein
MTGSVEAVNSAVIEDLQDPYEAVFCSSIRLTKTQQIVDGSSVKLSAHDTFDHLSELNV